MVAIAVLSVGSVYLYAATVQASAISSGSEKVHEALNDDEIEVIGFQLSEQREKILKLFVRNNSNWKVPGISVYLNGRQLCSGLTASENGLLEVDSANCPALGEEEVGDVSSSQVKVTSFNGSHATSLFLLGGS